MKPIDFHLETITPMFLGGADGKAFELRPPTFKGLMRFWWRAYHWGKNKNSIKHDDIEKKEGKIFGTALGDGLKSPFSIRIIPNNMEKPGKSPFPNHPIKVISCGRTFPINILEYLAYGTHEYKKGFIREYLPVKQQFTVRLIIPNNIDKQEIIKSFYMLSVFGGLGAKSRNGFGSFAVTNPEIFQNINLKYPFPDDTFLNTITQNTSTPNYSAFSSGIKILKLKQTYKTWDKCLAEIGKIYRETRGKIEPKHEYKKRQYIGAPLNAESYKSFLERRSKPYFMRVIKNGADYNGYILYLPSTYCHGKNKDRNNNPIDHQNVDQEFQNVCKQFNDYLNSNKGTEVIYEK